MVAPLNWKRTTWKIQKNAVLNKSSRVILQLNDSRSFPELVPLEPKLGVPASKSGMECGFDKFTKLRLGNSLFAFRKEFDILIFLSTMSEK